MDQKKRFYVYLYLRENADEHGAAGTPFYVGKGVGQRIHSKKGRPHPLPPYNCRKIIRKNLLEPDALDCEEGLIAEYGRICDGSGILINKSSRGGGAAGELHWRSKPAIALQITQEGRLVRREFSSLSEAADFFCVTQAEAHAVAIGKVRHAKNIRFYRKTDFEAGIYPCDELGRRGFFVALSPDGEYFWTDDQSEFARSIGLKQANIAQCLMSDCYSRTYKGWQFWREEDWALIHPIIVSGKSAQKVTLSTKNSA